MWKRPGTVDGEPFHKRSRPRLEQWKKFDVIVIGDIDSSYLLVPARQQQIEQMVSNGGGLLMLGGQNSFAPGGYSGIRRSKRRCRSLLGIRPTRRTRASLSPA